MKDLRKAIKITEKCFRMAEKLIEPGISEKQIAGCMKTLAHQLGAKRVAFTPIIATGKNAKQIHPKPTDRKIKENEFIIVDFGVVYGDARTDVTRTYCINPDMNKIKLIKLIKEAVEIGEKSVEVGAPCFKTDLLVRKYLKLHTKYKFPYDPAKAKDLLKEAGFPNGFKTTLIYAVGTNKDIPVGIQANLNAVGIQTDLELADSAKYQTYLSQPQPKGSLVLNPSVNAYRRLDPHFEAPNQIKVSPIDRGSMIRIPTANEKTARIEIRAVAPDANPYLVLYTIMRTGLEGKKLVEAGNRRNRLRFLPGTIHDAIRLFKASDFIAKILGEENKTKYLYFKEAVADKSPKELGRKVKTSEVIYHHEVTNQVLWNDF